VHSLTVCCLQSGLDPMHTIDLGIWVHLLTCIASKYERTLKTHRILTAKQINAVWDRLGSRAKELDADNTMFKLNEYKATFMRRLLLDLQSQQNQKKKGRNPQAWEHHLLMLVLYNACTNCAMCTNCVQTVCNMCTVRMVYKLCSNCVQHVHCFISKYTFALYRHFQG
jgi:hypothetical protein